MNNMVMYGSGRAQYNRYREDMVTIGKNPDSFTEWKHKRASFKKKGASKAPKNDAARLER